MGAHALWSLRAGAARLFLGVCCRWGRQWHVSRRRGWLDCLGSETSARIPVSLTGGREHRRGPQVPICCGRGAGAPAAAGALAGKGPPGSGADHGSKKGASTRGGGGSSGGGACGRSRCLRAGPTNPPTPPPVSPVASAPAMGPPLFRRPPHPRTAALPPTLPRFLPTPLPPRAPP